MSHELANPNQCQHLSPRGQHCHMLRVDGQSYCTYHLHRSEAAQPDPETLAAELLDGTGNLNTADRVNVLLGNLVRQLAQKRIDRQDALAIGYLAQLMLNSVPEIQKEYQAVRAAKAREAYRKSIAESQAPRAPAAAEAHVSSQAQRGTLAGSPSAAQQNVAAPPSSPASQFSEEALLAHVLQATSPPPR